MSPDRGEVVLSVTSDRRAEPYVAALRAAGIERIAVLTPETPAAEGRERIVGAAGLVLGGGADVDPARYGEPVLEGAGVELRPERDDLEWELLAGARARRLPAFCICRGLQVANVFLGGSLYQDISLQLPAALDHDRSKSPDTLAHAIDTLDEGGANGSSPPLAARLAGGLRLVNSRHHQALKRLGAGLVAAAVSRDGLIEAAELSAGSGWWLRGVQWHPENLIALAEQRVLWDDFARALRP